jgi:hypothetical protein
MKKQTLFLSLSIIISIKSFSQINFEKGYFINDSNQKIECFIKNIDWKNNPTKFEYKLSQDANALKDSIETVKEFAISGFSKYIRATVKIDRSRNNLNYLTTEKNPIFQEEKLFLKVLLEGNASLFLYEDGNLIRFFYNLNDSGIKQLVYKSYLIDNNVAQNNYFRQQLFIDLKCQSINLNDVEQLNYVKRDLERFFINYNECTSSSNINYELKQKQKKDLFNLSFRPGLNYSSLEIQNIAMYSSPSIVFDNKFSSRFGIEAEFILPFNKNKWGIIIEPTYQLNYQ